MGISVIKNSLFFYHYIKSYYLSIALNAILYMKKIFIKVKIFYLNNKIIKFMWINKKILHKNNFLFNILNKKLVLWKF